ncbi:MAG: hypothetical protein ACI3XA_06850 [Clostridia bacterium]
MSKNVNVVIDTKRPNVFKVARLTTLLVATVATIMPVNTYAQESNIEQIHYIRYSNENCIKGNEIVVDAMQQKNLRKIDLMAEFDENWNGNGGRAFTAEAISRFREVIKNVPTQPKIAPTGRNSLYMEYRKTDGSILAFEVTVTRVEMVNVPQGQYNKATVKQFEGDSYLENIINGVVEFNG